MSNRQFFGITHPYGQAMSDRPSVDSRPAIIRRLECPSCPQFRTNMFQKDDAGNPIPKHFCQLLDVENEKIEQDNQRRHPEARLKFYDCPFGPLELTLPRFPVHASDYVMR